MFEMPPGTIKDNTGKEEKQHAKPKKAKKEVIPKSQMLVGRKPSITIPQHQHPLTPQILNGHRCNVCRTGDLQAAYRCQACDFDCCFKCNPGM